MSQDPHDDHRSIKDLPPKERQDILDTLMSRIIEDIYTFCMAEDMALEDGKVHDAVELIERFFEKYDLKLLATKNVAHHLARIAFSARREL